MWAGAWLELDPELRRLRRWKVTTAGFCGVHGHGAVACTPPIASSDVSRRRDHIHTWWALLQDEAEARAGSSAREEVALAWVSEITQRTEQAAGSGGGGGSGGTTVVASSQGSRHVSIRFHSGGDVAAAAASSSAAWQLLFPKKRMARDFVQLVGWCSSAPVQEAAAAVAAAGGGQAWARAAAEARCELEAQATETPGKVLGHVEVNIVDQDGWRSVRVPLHEHRRCIYNVKQVRHCILKFKTAMMIMISNRHAAAAAAAAATPDLHHTHQRPTPHWQRHTDLHSHGASTTRHGSQSPSARVGSTADACVTRLGMSRRCRR
jgi:hypothetical protein